MTILPVHDTLIDVTTLSIVSLDEIVEVPFYIPEHV